MTNEMSAPDFYALLIGIDCYLPNRLPGNLYYRNLEGCVRDISHVEAFLQKKLGLSGANIIKLTASDAGTGAPTEPREQWPTYENIVKAFQRLTENGRAGDQVYIHYSGHGGRSPTLLPELKGERGLDESLVPTDIGDASARYLRDIELATLLKSMVDKRMVVTVVLDSCHSGSATRSAGATVRGLSVVDTTVRPASSLVGSREELAATWRALTDSATRNVDLGSGWLPEPQGYVLLAACRACEAAFEYAFDGEESNGALTYWLLDSLQTNSPGLTYKHIHDRIVAKIHSQFPEQTPQLQGEGNRIVFGSDRVQPQYGVTVLQVDSARGRVLLATGQSQGVREGAQFAVYARGTLDLTQFEARVAIAKVSSLGASESWAEYEMLRETAIEQGADAVLINPGALKLVRKVRLIKNEQLQSEVPQEQAFEAVERAIVESGWVALADADEHADYQISIDGKGDYVILNAACEPVRRLSPAIKFDEDGAAAKIVSRLVHLARYNATLQLDNHDPLSLLAGRLVVELVGKQKVYDPADKPQPEAFGDTGDTPTINAGEWTFIRIKNTSSRILNVVVLNLQPDWGISQLYPSGQDWFMPFDAGQEMTLPLRADLPNGYEEGTDVIKVIAAVGSANFHWLELPPLGEPSSRQRQLDTSPQDWLAQLVGVVATGETTMRNLTPAVYPSQEWVAAQVEIRITSRQ